MKVEKVENHLHSGVTLGDHRHDTYISRSSPLAQSGNLRKRDPA